MTALLALALLVQGYTTADPVDPDRLGLATASGRYAVRVWDGCAEIIAPGQNVLIAGELDSGAMIGTENYLCALTEAVLMDATPCFTNADGICDVSLEQAEVY